MRRALNHRPHAMLYPSQRPKRATMRAQRRRSAHSRRARETTDDAAEQAAAQLQQRRDFCVFLVRILRPWPPLLRCGLGPRSALSETGGAHSTTRETRTRRRSLEAHRSSQRKMSSRPGTPLRARGGVAGDSSARQLQPRAPLRIRKQRSLPLSLASRPSFPCHLSLYRHSSAPSYLRRSKLSESPLWLSALLRENRQRPMTALSGRKSSARHPRR